MKRLSLFIFFIFCFRVVFSQDISLDETRKLYARSAQDKETCERLYARLSTAQTNENIVLSGYYGAVAANMANYKEKPAEKIKIFNFGRRLLEKAIIADSTNLELRFLRFTIQSNCPKALQYDKHIQTDKIFIISHLDSGKNGGLQKKIAAYLATSKSFTDEEKEKIRLVLAKD